MNPVDPALAHQVFRLCRKFCFFAYSITGVGDGHTETLQSFQVLDIFFKTLRSTHRSQRSNLDSELKQQYRSDQMLRNLLNLVLPKDTSFCSGTSLGVQEEDEFGCYM